MNSRVQADMFKHDMYKIYSLLCEGALSIWLDAGCSPLPSQSIAANNPCAHNFLGRIRRLDSVEYSHGSSALIDDALSTSLQAYASQWLWRSDKSGKTSPLLTKELWSRSREKVHNTMALPSYRAFFSLMLFGWTPVPKDCGQNSFEPVLSMEVALKQFSHLRPDQRVSPDDPNHGTVYWFGIVFDTAVSCITRRPPTLKAIPAGKVWDVIEARDISYLSLLESIDNVTNDLIIDVCRAGSACKIHAWRLINKIQTAVFLDKNDPIKLEKMINDAKEKLGRFDQVYAPFLDKCASKFGTFSPYAQMSWVFLRSHVALGHLLFAEVLEQVSARGYDHGIDVDSIKLVTALQMGETARTVEQHPLSEKFLLQTSLPPFSNIFMIDPFPEFMIEPLRMSAVALLALRRDAKIDSTIALDNAKDCLSGLETLRDHSLSARKAVDELSAELALASSMPVFARTKDEMKCSLSPIVTDAIQLAMSGVTSSLSPKTLSSLSLSPTSPILGSDWSPDHNNTPLTPPTGLDIDPTLNDFLTSTFIYLSPSTTPQPVSETPPKSGRNANDHCFDDLEAWRSTFTFDLGSNVSSFEQVQSSN